MQTPMYIFYSEFLAGFFYHKFHRILYGNGILKSENEKEKKKDKYKYKIDI